MNIFEQAHEIVGDGLLLDPVGWSYARQAEAIVAKLEEAGLLRDDPPEDGEVMAFRTTGNNSHIIEDCFELGYLTDEMYVLDMTYGKGTFWKRHRPPGLVMNDLDPRRGDAHLGTVWHEDFTRTGFADGQFDAVVFDPDYKMQGTSSNAGPASSNGAYGMDREYRAVADQLGIIGQGLVECVRVTKPRGVIAVKYMDQIVSGNPVWQSDLVGDVMTDRYCNKIAQFHLAGHRKQPTHDKCRKCKGTGDWTDSEGELQECLDCDNGKVPRRQVHERRNYSTLTLYRKAF